jgi:hypothetical protein
MIAMLTVAGISRRKRRLPILPWMSEEVKAYIRSVEYEQSLHDKRRDPDRLIRISNRPRDME